MTDTILGAVIGVGGAIIGAILAGPVTYYFSKVLIKITHKNAIDLMQRQEFFAAASKFKATVLYELIGFYPIDQYWEQKEVHRLRDSIPKINSAAAEFRYFVARQSDFDKAVSEYNQYCRENRADKAFGMDYSKSMDVKSPNDYRKEFKDIVEHLLSFTDEK